MIETIYLEIIVLLLLVWIMEGKLIPQTIIMFLALIMMINQITTATDLQSIVSTIVLYGVIVLYSGVSVLYKKDEQ